MFEENMDGVTPTRRLTSQDISSPLGTTETVNPETGLTGDSKSARRLSNKEISEGFMVDTGGISPIISNTPGGLRGTEKIIGEGEYHPELGPAYNAQLLHERQTATGMFANALVQAGAQVAGQVIQGVGYISDLDAGARLSNDAEADFGNAIADFGTNLINTAQEKFPIYVDPFKADNFDPGSWSWWMQNLPSAASSIALMVPAAAATKGIMALGDLAKLTSGLSSVARTSVEGMTEAIFSRKAESMMEAQGVWQQNYDSGLKSGLSEKDARIGAALAASNTYKKNWALLVQDVPQYILLNKLGVLKVGGKAAEKTAGKEMSGAMASWLGRDRLATTMGKVGAVAMDAAGEGGEEIYQYLLNNQSNSIAAHQANPEKNQAHSMLDELKNSYDDGQMWTAGFWGAAGAGLMMAGGAALNHNMIQKAAQAQIDTVTKFSTGLNQANKEYSTALDKGDPILAEQALPNLIFQTALKGHFDGSLVHTKEMLSELQKGTSPELFAKWGIDPETQGRLKNDPDFAKKVNDGMDRVVELYERYNKENQTNNSIKGKDKEANAQIMANTQFLMENTEKLIPTIEKRRDDAWTKIEGVEKISNPAQQIVGLGAQKRGSQLLLDHFEKTLKENGDKMGEVEKKETEAAIEETKLQMAQIDNAVKEKQKELKTLHKSDPAQAEVDKTTVLPEDQVDIFRKEAGRLSAAQASMKELTSRMKKLREGKSILDLQKEAIQESLGLKEEDQVDRIQPDDKVQFNDETTGLPITGKVIGFQTETADNEANIKYEVQPLDEKTGEPIGVPVTKDGLDLFLDEKHNDAINEEVAPDELSAAEQKMLDGQTDEETQETEQQPLSTISKLSYSDRDHGSRNSAFSKLISDPKTSFTGSKAYFFLDRSSEKSTKLLTSYVEKFATAKQKPIINKFIDGKKLKATEVEVLLEAITGNKYRDLVDTFPISVRTTVAGKTFEEGMFLHSSDFNNINIPKQIRRQGKKAIEIYRAKKYKEARENRVFLLRKLLMGEDVYSIGLNRSRGVPNVMDKKLPAVERNRNISAILGKAANEIRLAITVSDETNPDRASLRDTKDNIISGTEKVMNNAGNVYALISGETIDGSQYPLKLNRPYIGKEHAEILFDAFVLVGRAKVNKRRDGKAVHAYNVQFMNGEERVKGLSAGEVIDLLVNNGREMTEPNTGRFKKRNIKPGQAELMANKRLYLAISGKRVVLVYGNDVKTGNPYTIDLNNNQDISGKRQHFLDWISANKRYAIYLGSKKLKLSLNGDFLNKKTFTIGKTNPITRKGVDSYSKFIIDNGLVETDAVRDENGNLFHDPVISLNMTDRYGKVTDQTVKTKPGNFVQQQRGRTVTEKETVQDVPESTPITKDDVKDEKAFESTQTPGQNEEDKQTSQGVETEGTYRNQFSTKKQRVVYHNGTEYAHPEDLNAVTDLSDLIERSMRDKKTLDETIADVRTFLNDEQLKIGSKGATANKGLIQFIRDRFEGKTTNSLQDEWSNIKSEETAITTVPIIEGMPSEDEVPAEIPKVKSLDDIMGAFAGNKRTKGNKMSKIAREGVYDVADVIKDIQWAYDVVGIDPKDWDIKTKMADLVYGGRRNFALYSQSAILIYNAAETGTVYHEAFHRVTLGYFTPKERAQLYRAAKQIYKLDETTTDKQINELLSEKFEGFMLSNGEKKAPGIIDRFFQRITNFIKKVFFGKRRLDENEIDQLFNQIRDGKFKSSKVRDENQHLLELGEYAKTMVGGTYFNNLNTREDVKDLIKGLTEKLFDVNLVNNINNVGELKHAPLISSIENLLEELKSNVIDNTQSSDDDKLNGQHLYDLFSEVLGTKDAITGMYDTYSLLIRPQIDSFLSSMGVKQTGIADSSDEYLMDEIDDNGVAKETTVSKVGGNYFEASYERNKKETALSNIKFMIATLHETSNIDPETGERVFDRNSMTHMGKFADFSKTWSKIFNSLYWINNVDDMVSELKVLGEEQQYSPFLELAEKLENESEMTRNQFFVTVRSSKHNFINFSAYNTGNYGVKMRINKSAFNEAFFSEVAVWNELFFNDDKVTRSETAKIKGQIGYVYRSYFRKEFFNAVEEDYSNLENQLLEARDKVKTLKPSQQVAFVEKETNKAIEQITFLLNRFNIDVDEDTIRRLISQRVGEDVKDDLDRVYNYLDTRLSTVLSSNLASQAALNEDQIDRKTMGFFKQEEILNIARAYIEAHPEKMDDMQLGPDRNIYNTFSENNHATETANRINHEDGYVESKIALTYNKHGRFYNDMMPKSNDPEVIDRAMKKRAMFGLRTFSYLQEQGTGDKGRGFLDITELEDYLIKYTSMFNPGITTEEDKMLPIPSLPRKTYMFMAGVRQFDRVMEDYKNGKIVFTKEVLDYYYDQYLDELERITEANDLLTQYKVAKGDEKEAIKNSLVKNYHYAKDFNFSEGNAYDFIHFKGFSKTQMARVTFNKKLTDVLNKRVSEELKYANSIGVIAYDETSKEYDPGMLDRVHTEEYSTKFNDNEDIGTRGAIADFALNYSMATIESEKMFLADPAFFAKSVASGEVFDDVYKRWFGVGSSGENYTETTKSDPNNFYNVLVLNTQKFKAPFYDAMYNRHVELWKEYLTQHNPEKLTEDKIDILASKITKERLSEYEKVDATDGQAWISPTMYKNMLERSGMWSPEIQVAFEVLNSDKKLSAEEEIKLLNVVLNPQKTAYFGNNEHNGLDLLVYDKMSMTVLFKRLVKGSHIEDLFDRMELTGKYANQEGLNKIHVVNFDSVIKVGGRRGYDLFTDGKTRNQTNDFTKVFTTQQYWKNLRKQQVEDPKEDFTQQTLGSQVYKIASSNIIKNEPYGNYESGMDMLNALTQSRVAISNNGKHKIEAALGIKDGKVNNINLIRMLRKDAEKAKKPDDFIRALKVDKNTGRNYLELDAFPDRRWIYSRLSRLVTSNTIDLVTPGAQLIQSSDYGFSSREYDNELGFNILDKGANKTIQMEVKVSIRMFRHLIRNYADLTHEQRVAAIEKLELPLLGYRIPTQGQNSIVSLKIKEFLPDSAGDVIHLPLAFTALTGSDFDIDKLFTMFHNFERDESGKLRKVEFSDKTDEASVQNRYNRKVEELYRIYRSDDTVITKEVYDKLKEARHDENLQETISMLKQDSAARYANYDGQLRQLEELYKGTEDSELKDEYYKEITMLTSLIDDLLEQEGRNISKEVDKAKLPVKLKALTDAGKLQSLNEFKNLSLEDQNTSTANQNRIIDIFHTVIRDSKHYLSTSQPLGGVTNQLKARAARNERVENGGKLAQIEALGSTIPKFQSETKFKFMTSSKGIGPFALSNAQHSLTQMASVRMKTKFKYGVESGGTVPLDLIVGSDRVYITDWLSAMIDAHVDAVKDNYITKLNVNDATYGVTALMLRLGLGIKTFDFLSQPILKEYAREYFSLGGRIRQEEEDSSDDGLLADRAYRRVWNRYLEKLHFDTDEDVNLFDGDLYIPFDKLINNEKQLEKDLDPSLRTDEDRNKRQLNILFHFKHILDDATELNKLVLETRIDTKKIGATPAEQQFSLNKLKELEEKGKFPGMDRLINSRGEFVKNGTMLAPMLRNSLTYLQGMMSNNTVYGSKGFNDLFWDMAYSVPGSATMRLSSVNNLVEEMFSYFSGEFFGNPENGIGVDKAFLEKLLLNGPTSVFGLLSKIRKRSYKLYDELSKNKMLNILRTDSKPGIPLETYIRMPFTSTSDKWTNDDYIEAFHDLFTHPDMEVKALARALYMYSYYSTGFRHRFRGYVKYIPSEVQKAILMQNVSTKQYNQVSYNDYIYNLIKELNDGHTATPKYLETMKREVFINNWFNKWFVPNVDNPELVKNSFNDANGTTRLIELEVGKNSKYVLGTNLDGDTIYAHFITMKGAADYNKPTAKQEVNPMESVFGEVAPDTEEFRGSNVSLLEFIGVNDETGFPVYKPINKKGFYELGNILREYGIRNGQSVIAQNNLSKQFTDEQTLSFAQKEIQLFREISFGNQNVTERAIVQKEEYATNVAQDMMNEDKVAREAIRSRIMYDQIQVTKVISGLQTGFDTDGVLVASDLGYETGGRTTVDNTQEGGVSNEDLARELGVSPMSAEEQAAWAAQVEKKETPEGYSNMLKNKRLLSRTYWNVANSDATVYFAEDVATTDKARMSRGFFSTRKAASNKYYKKPFLFYVSKEAMDNGFKETYDGNGIMFSNAEELRYLLKKYQVNVLNVAGSRLSTFKKYDSLGKLEMFRNILKDALTKENPTKEQQTIKENVDNKSNPESLSSYAKPINLYVDGSVQKESDLYGYGVYANISDRAIGLSGTKEDVDKEFFSKFPDVKNQDQFNPSMELLGLVNALRMFENTAEHLVIRQDYEGSISYIGLESRAVNDPFRKKYNPKQPHIKYLVGEATKLIDKIEKNGGSVRIFYVPSHGDKSKIEKYIKAYSDKEGITITQRHIDIVTHGNDQADKLAKSDKKMNTFAALINQIGTAKPTGLKPGFEKNGKEDERGREEMLNCRK